MPISLEGLTPLKIPEGAVRQLTPEEKADFRETMMKMLEFQYTEMVPPSHEELSKHPSQQLYATIKDAAGNTIAKVFNGGPVETSNAMGGQLSGMPGTGAQARAEWLARKFGGRIQMESTAVSDAAFAKLPPPPAPTMKVDWEGLKNDPWYKSLFPDDRQTIAAPTQKALLETQETTYDFTTMTRREIAETGKQLFKEGRITLDELFRFDHPDGKLKIDLAGNHTELNPDDRINFIAETQTAIRNLEETGHAWLPKSPYTMFQGLLAKLTAMQKMA